MRNACGAVRRITRAARSTPFSRGGCEVCSPLTFLQVFVRCVKPAMSLSSGHVSVCCVVTSTELLVSAGATMFTVLKIKRCSLRLPLPLPNGSWPNDSVE
ncbi:hypothetical protein MRX96_009444 [Rhipicephalus microplus]